MNVGDLQSVLDGLPHEAKVVVRSAGDDGKPVFTPILGASTEYRGFCDPEYTVYLSLGSASPQISPLQEKP